MRDLAARWGLAAARLGAFLFVVAMFSFGLWRIDQDNRDDEARRCVTAWETREDIRDAVGRAATAGAEALIAIAPDADPAKVDAYRVALDDQVAAARAEIPNPDCSLVAARVRLD